MANQLLEDIRIRSSHSAIILIKPANYNTTTAPISILIQVSQSSLQHSSFHISFSTKIQTSMSRSKSSPYWLSASSVSQRLLLQFQLKQGKRHSAPPCNRMTDTHHRGLKTDKFGNIAGIVSTAGNVINDVANVAGNTHSEWDQW